jgi:hypothetical protein
VPFNRKSGSSTLNGISAGGEGDGVARGRAGGVAGGGPSKEG